MTQLQAGNVIVQVHEWLSGSTCRTFVLRCAYLSLRLRIQMLRPRADKGLLPEVPCAYLWLLIIKAAESESRQELELVGVDRFGWSRSWSR